jgi:hypothetical protein
MKENASQRCPLGFTATIERQPWVRCATQGYGVKRLRRKELEDHDDDYR